MPSMEWDNNISKWARRCSKCNTEYTVDGEWEEAFVSMKKYFYTYAPTGRGPIDGLRSSCKTCVTNHINGRKGDGKSREVMLISQEGKCGLCSKDISFEGNTANIDHNKTTGKIREVLCTKCNLGISYFDNNLEWLRKALTYLEKYDNENN